MASIGSCKIGFNPNHSLGEGENGLNGFELNMRKNKTQRKFQTFCTFCFKRRSKELV